MTKSELLLSLSSATLTRKERFWCHGRLPQWNILLKGYEFSFKISMPNSLNKKSYYWFFSIYLRFFSIIFLQYSFLVHLYSPSIRTAPFLTLPFFSMWLMKILIQVPRTFILLSALFSSENVKLIHQLSPLLLFF